MGSTAYGEGKETEAIKSGAPKSKTRGIADNVGGRPVTNVLAQAPVTPLFAPSQRPDEPATTGIDIGPGAGSEALAMPKQDDTNFRTAISEYRPVLNFISDQPNTSPETRAAIKKLFDSL
jgi:hypothetical protein